MVPRCHVWHPDQQKGPLFEPGSKNRRFPPHLRLYTWAFDTWACPKHTDLKLIFSIFTHQSQTNRSRIHCAISKVPGRALNLPWLAQFHHFFPKLELWGVEKNTWNYVIRYGFLRVFYGVFMGFLRLRIFLRVFCWTKPGFWYINRISIFLAKFVIWPNLNGIVGSFEKSLRKQTGFEASCPILK